MPDQALVLTIPEAADRLRLSRRTVYRLLDEGALEAIHIRGARRIRVSALERFLNRCQTEHRARGVGFE